VRSTAQPALSRLSVVARPIIPVPPTIRARGIIRTYLPSKVGIEAQVGDRDSAVGKVLGDLVEADHGPDPRSVR